MHTHTHARMNCNGIHGVYGVHGVSPLSAVLSRFDADTAELQAERDAIIWEQTASAEELDAALAEWDAAPWE